MFRRLAIEINTIIYTLFNIIIALIPGRPATVARPKLKKLIGRVKSVNKFNRINVRILNKEDDTVDNTAFLQKEILRAAMSKIKVIDINIIIVRFIKLFILLLWGLLNMTGLF